MKYYFLLVYLLGIGITSCNNKKVLEPAISFCEDIVTLQQKESNKLIEHSNCAIDNEPESFGHHLQLMNLKYLTERKDTISYEFVRSRLFSVFITTPNNKYENVVERFRTDEKVSEMKIEFEKGLYEMKLFKKDTNIIVIWEEENNTTSLLYLNNENNELEDVFESIFKDSGSLVHNHKIFHAHVLISLYARATIAPTNYNTYYNKMLRIFWAN
jgi:hypothetical protein